MVWRSLAILVEYGHVEMVISTVVGMFADIQDISLARQYGSLRGLLSTCLPMYSSFAYADFCGPSKSACLLTLFVFPVFNSRRTAVFRWTDRRP